MTRETARLIEEALQLPEDDRARLAGELLRSLDTTEEPLGQEEYDAAWNEEIGRRLREIDDGSATPVPWDSARHTIASDK